ncbi:MAG TPA: glycosyltransferase [Gemmataceae bacterium]|jgi:dolichyl-phosphate beta-glucosyltransferase|nr:glycosyltransferase [Gemmataceae bacterium]
MSLVLPAFNPGQLVERTWRKVRDFVRERGSSWEIIFVCDGCTDGTPERLAKLNEDENASMRILSYAKNQGKGYAVRQGLLAARGQYRLFTDVDLAYDFDDVDRIADALRQGAEVAIASRTHPDSRLIMPPHLQGYAYRRHLQSRVFSMIVRLLLTIPPYDTQAGLKGMTARAARLLLPPLVCNGFGFDCELLSAGVRAGLKIAEIPVSVRFEDGTSTTGFRAARRMLAEIWRVRQSQNATPPPQTQPPSQSDIAAAA